MTSHRLTQAWLTRLGGAALLATIPLPAARVPPAEVPAGLELVLAAAPPLVVHPLMGCLDDRGRLFVGDSAGLNLNQQGLEEQLPNRVLMLEDLDEDGTYDRSTVFADRMTFPQGAAWLDGSLYVASPPGIWKLTDTNDDGVADEREMIVGGFGYDGNAADVHGPFLHPTNGRLYWCHGRKGHRVVQPDGTLVHEGRASGIWSARPDGSDIEWHSLGSMDNPVEIDFTPEGDLFGVVNLYYNQPRGDTLMHWLYGGVYERPDQLAAIAGLPRMLEHMPVVHNHGHVAVAGSTFYRSGNLNSEWKGDFLVTYFNTQKLVRTRLIPAGSTFRATEHPLLKINDPDVHLTDVIEDADGSLLILDTGGWFRIGCPASLAEKPDLRGAIYRLRKTNSPPLVDGYGRDIPWDRLSPDGLAELATDERWMVREKAVARLRSSEPEAPVTATQLLDAGQPQRQLRACATLAQAKQLDTAQRAALRQLLAEPLDPALEHAAMYAAMVTGAVDVPLLREAQAPRLARRLMVIIEQSGPDQATRDALLEISHQHIDTADPELARVALAVVSRHDQAMERSYGDFASRLAAPRLQAGSLKVISEVTANHLAKPQAQELVTVMLNHAAPAVRQAAWRILARQSRVPLNPAWLAPLERSLALATKPTQRAQEEEATERVEADLPLLLEAVGKLDTRDLDPALQGIVTDERQPQPVRLQALAALARGNEPLPAEAFALLHQISTESGSPIARIEAARLFARSRLSQEQLRAIAPALASAGPVELAELLKLGRRMEPATGPVWAESLAQSSVVSTLPEGTIKTAFSSVPPEIYEQTLAPIMRAAAEAEEDKARKLELLVAEVRRGRAAEGRRIYEGSSCLACHTVGELGRAMGPDLSLIGRIRTERDLLESILFPHATIARDYETHLIETAHGESHLGLVKSDGPDGVVLMDMAGQPTTIPPPDIVGRSLLTTSLMPAGLEQAFTEQELLDLIAYLMSLQ